MVDIDFLKGVDRTVIKNDTELLALLEKYDVVALGKVTGKALESDVRIFLMGISDKLGKLYSEIDKIATEKDIYFCKHADLMVNGRLETFFEKATPKEKAYNTIGLNVFFAQSALKCSVIDKSAVLFKELVLARKTQ